MTHKIKAIVETAVVAEKIEEVATTLEQQAHTLRLNARSVRAGRIHHANEAISTICNLQTLVNINALINAMINQGQKNDH
jgi:hypothetical protein